MTKKKPTKRPAGVVGIAALVNDLSNQVAALTQEVGENRKYAGLVKSEVVAQAETRDAERQCKHLAGIVEQMRKELAECTMAKAIDGVNNLSERFWRVERDVQKLQQSVEVKANTCDVISLQSDVRALFEEINREEEEDDEPEPEPGEYVHSGSCFKAGDDVRTSCPECEPERAPGHIDAMGMRMAHKTVAEAREKLLPLFSDREGIEVIVHDVPQAHCELFLANLRALSPSTVWVDAGGPGGYLLKLMQSAGLPAKALPKVPRL